MNKNWMDGLRVLVVDDNGFMLKLTKAMLRQIGSFEILLVGSGRRALEEVKTRPPDIILLDWMMPGMGGGEVLAALRDELHYTFPVIVVTAWADRAVVVQAAKLGAFGVVVKPYSVKILERHLQMALDAHPDFRSISADPPELEARSLAGALADDLAASGRSIGDGQLLEDTRGNRQAVRAALSDAGLLGGRVPARQDDEDEQDDSAFFL